jgi:hypothetical protein
MLIDIRPVDNKTAADDSEVVSLRFGRMKQAWVPRKRNGQRATVQKIDTQRIFRNANRSDALADPRFRSTHSMLSDTLLFVLADQPFDSPKLVT